MTDNEEDWWTEGPANLPVETWFNSEHKTQVSGELAHSVTPHDANHLKNGHQKHTGPSSEHIHDVDDVGARLRAATVMMAINWWFDWMYEIYLGEARNAQKEETGDGDGCHHHFLLTQSREFIVDAGQAQLHQGKLSSHHYNLTYLILFFKFEITWVSSPKM